MKRDVVEYVNYCLICQQIKVLTHLPCGLLQPLPIPEGVWEDVSLDFIVGLPSFQGYTIIFVVVDYLSKVVHFGMLLGHFIASKVANLFAKMVCELHGMLKSIVYRDPVFLGHFLP